MYIIMFLASVYVKWQYLYYQACSNCKHAKLGDFEGVQFCHRLMKPKHKKACSVRDIFVQFFINHHVHSYNTCSNMITDDNFTHR